MAKKAFLVDISIRTRVVVDISDDCTDQNPTTNDGLWSEIADKAEVQVGNDIWDYLIQDNVTEIVEDTEMPYDPEYDLES